MEGVMAAVLVHVCAVYRVPSTEYQVAAFNLEGARHGEAVAMHVNMQMTD